MCNLSESGVSSTSITCPLSVSVTWLYGYCAWYGAGGSPVFGSGVLLIVLVPRDNLLTSLSST